MTSIRIRAIVFKEDGLWCAQCIERDIAVQASSKEQLIDELVAILDSYVQLAIDENVEPFSGIPPAPIHFEQMFESARRDINRVPSINKDEAPTIVPTLRLFEAFPV